MNNQSYAPNALKAQCSSLNSLQAGCDVQKRIPAGHDLIFKRLAELHESLGGLEARLSPALRIEPSPPQEKPDAPRPPSVTIYEKLDSHADSINIATSRVQELLRLLEL